MNQIRSRVPAAEYHALPGISITHLKELKRSALHYQYRLDHPSVTVPLTLGTASHCAVLEPERFERQFAVWDRRTDSGRMAPRNGKWWDAFQAANDTRTILTEDERDEALAIGQAVRSDPIAARYLENGEPEVSMQWRMEVGGIGPEVDCRGRPDWITHIDGKPCLVGLKTARDARPFVFGSAAAKLSYHLQWAFYFDGYKAIRGVEPSLREIVVESSAPHDVVVYIIPEDIVLQGRQEYGDLIRHLIDCEKRQEWLGVAQGVEQVLTLPSWIYVEQDDLTELELEE